MEITHKQKFILLSSIITVAILIVTLYFLIGTGKESSTGKTGVLPKSPVAIPVDAIVIFTFPEPDKLSLFLFKEKPLAGEFFSGLYSFRKVIERVSELLIQKDSDKETFDCAISLHYSAKDKVSPLLVINHEGVESDLLIKVMESKSENVATRTFNGIKIWKSDGVEYTVTDNKFIASTSAIILESSLRHIKSGISVLDNEEFSQAFKSMVLTESLLFLNHLQTGKLFSAFIDRTCFGGVEFISRFSGWSAFELSSDKYSIRLTGQSFENKGIGNYATVFRDEKNGSSTIQSILPSDTYMLLDLSLTDLSKHIKNLIRYKEFYGKSLSEVNKNAVNWVESLKPKEVAVALVPFEGELHWITIIRRSNPWYNTLEEKIGVKERDAVIRSFHNKGYMARVFGEFFSYTTENSMLESGEWIFIGENALLTGITSGIFKNFTMEQYLSGTKAHILTDKRGSMVKLIVNGSIFKDSLFSYFRDDHAVKLRKRFSDRNIMIAALEINSGKNGEPVYNLYAFADSMAVPVPPVKKSPSTTGYEKKITPMDVNKGPFEVKNFTNGDTEYLEQIPSGGLRLLSKDKKGVWTIPFSGKICGRVLQVDYFNNGKLQMLFADANQLYLLDRLGRFVNPFPKKVDHEIILGPQIYDLKGDGDMAIMLLHKDNTLRLYDKSGSLYPMWSDIVIQGPFKGFPELLKDGTEKYLVLRSETVTEIFTANGIRVTNLTGNNRLSSNTPVESAGKGIVAVKTVKGRKIYLDLETGNIKQGK
ncbi:MAG: hypothetical protein AB9922_03840 [Bacteroidales bacterium]